MDWNKLNDEKELERRQAEYIREALEMAKKSKNSVSVPIQTPSVQPIMSNEKIVVTEQHEPEAKIVAPVIEDFEELEGVFEEEVNEVKDSKDEEESEEDSEEEVENDSEDTVGKPSEGTDKSDDEKTIFISEKELEEECEEDEPETDYVLPEIHEDEEDRSIKERTAEFVREIQAQKAAYSAAQIPVVPRSLNSSVNLHNQKICPNCGKPK